MTPYPAIAPLLETAFKAGKAIMDVYERDIKVELKSDESPVTEADAAAEEIILEHLKTLAPGIPVIAEEAVNNGHLPDIHDLFFLVDPLDGTKEFINRRDEFTVNIALIENNIPIMGVVYAPALKTLYYASTPETAFTATLDCTKSEFCLENKKPLKVRIPEKDQGLTVVMSRSHLNAETENFLKKYTIANTASAGSSLKFCLLANGQADLYPRLARTMEWDTAAGQAVLMAAGGQVLTEQGQTLTYGKTKDHYANPGFIAWGKHPG